MTGEPESIQKILLVTPELTSVLECNESSQTFSDKVQAMKTSLSFTPEFGATLGTWLIMDFQ